MHTTEEKLSPQTKKLITAVSVVIPLAVAILFKVKIDGVDLSFLPPIYAGINAVTVVTLLMALVAIKKKNIDLHRLFIQFSLVLSLFFLLCYVAYHITSDSTAFGGEGTIRTIYYFVLISHIVLSVGIIPLVLFSYAYGINNLVTRHKKLVRYAFPLWIYVAATGVIVYLMISPYYA
ncbi:DUF420 domain-containing protein [Luteibaculum oceani]|uniref:DUF420 domain-containing protein n=1 Tax=Luteibaculum oceani TaxID=1294296 RepID=A0A5C6VI07_9FLAO|nr:DUF420 domain-containing protein [Luteibaculum oceani]TXC85042.1 DUF420 domain-containing protein [Luteibaculum oceani]